MLTAEIEAAERTHPNRRFRRFSCTKQNRCFRARSLLGGLVTAVTVNGRFDISCFAKRCAEHRQQQCSFEALGANIGFPFPPATTWGKVSFWRQKFIRRKLWINLVLRLKRLGFIQKSDHKVLKGLAKDAEWARSQDLPLCHMSIFLKPLYQHTRSPDLTKGGVESWAAPQTIQA
jgi:hypothetical protein